jgi:hypothetical protein
MEAIGSRRRDPLPGSHVPWRSAVCWTGDSDAAEHVHVSPKNADAIPLLIVRIGLGVASMGLVTIYPFMKRITYYPQITFGQPALPNCPHSC